jgi:cytosine/adenosine deaminase-related metal-dependent hydrolase
VSRTLFTNAIVVTCDGGMTVHRPGWLLIEGAKILDVGSGEPPRPDGVDVVDCGGDILMPGLVNTHCHIAMSVFRGLGEDMNDRLRRYVFPLEKRFVSPEMVRVGTRLGALELIEGGTTTVADMYYFETEVGRVIDECGMRGIVGQTIVDFAAPDAANVDEGFARFEECRAAFARHPRVTASLAPHAPYTTGLEILKRVAETWERTGAPVQIHLAEMDYEPGWVRERYNGTPVDLMEQAGLLREGLIAAHCIFVEERDRENMARAGVRVAHNAGSNAKAGRPIAPVVAMRKAGIKVGLGSDGPMSGNTIDLFAQFPQVAKLQKLANRDGAAIRSVDVVRMATIEGAEVLGMADRTGSLEKGKRADLIRIDTSATRFTPLYDPHATLVYATLASDVRDVVCDGEWLMRDRKVTRLDRRAVIADGRALGDEMRAEMSRIDAQAR